MNRTPTNILSKCIDFALYSNLWIALGAYAQTARSISICDKNPDATMLPMIIGIGTLSFYSALRLLKLPQQDMDHGPVRLGSVRIYRGILIAGCLMGFIPLLYWIAVIDDYNKGLFFFFAACTLAYGWAFGLVTIREIPYLKSFFVPAIWVCVTVLVPMHACPMVWQVAAERFLFILAITLPFDLRDARVDAAEGIRTLANQFHTSWSVCLSLVALTSSLLLSEMEPITLLVGALAAALILYLRIARHPWWYYGALDALLILGRFGV